MIETICTVGVQVVESDEENSGSGGRITTDISFSPSRTTVERSKVSTAEGATFFVMDDKKEENGASSASSFETTPFPSELQTARANF